jgi:hypothetical protein
MLLDIGLFANMDPGQCLLNIFALDSLIFSVRPPLWSSAQNSWLLTQKSWARFPALSDVLSSSGSGTGSTQPHEDK